MDWSLYFSYYRCSVVVQVTPGAALLMAAGHARASATFHKLYLARLVKRWAVRAGQPWQHQR